MNGLAIFAMGFVAGVVAQISLMRWLRGILERAGMFDSREDGNG